jgi:predicted patatin/cPLA2 family phospholipase
VKIKEIAPPENLEMHRVTRDLKSLEAAYQAGIEYGSSHIKGYDAQPVLTKHKTENHYQMFG